MNHIRKCLPILEPKRKEEGKFLCFLQNGSSLAEKLIVSLGGRYQLPIPSFTAEEIIRATKNFSEPVRHISDRCYMFKGTLKERAVLVKIFPEGGSECALSGRNIESIGKAAIQDIVITSQMSHLKNVLQLIGCCLEMRYPAMVYEYAGTKLLPSLLNHPNDHELLSWRSRLKIARDIATVIARLHTDFPTPIIYRDLNPSKVIIDQYGVVKLFDFADSISLPPGKLKVEAELMGTYGYVDPEYLMSSYVTQKSDVYGFGVLMLVLFTGETTPFMRTKGDGENIHVIDYVRGNLQKDQLNQIVDPNIFFSKEEISNAQRQQMLDFVDLALRCTEFEGEDRPDMIDVAKELSQIEKNCPPC